MAGRPRKEKIDLGPDNGIHLQWKQHLEKKKSTEPYNRVH